MSSGLGGASPPDELPARLAIETLPAGDRLWRSHRPDLDPWYLSCGNPTNRFDDPERHYGVCYTARTPTAAFAETFLRRPKGQFIDETELEAHCLTPLTFKLPLRLVWLYGPGLKQNHQTAAVTTGPVEPAQAYAAVLYRHPDTPDGIVYRVRHDDDQFGVALFDRCPAPTVGITGVWRSHPELNLICERYELKL